MKDMDMYYHVTWVRSEFVILSTFWLDNSNHYERAYCGNVFKTYEEADANKYDVYERLTGKKWRTKSDE